MLKRELLDIALNQKKADLVLKNCLLVDVFNEQFIKGNLAIAEGIIIGMGDYQGEKEIDLEGQIVTPGFIDGHLHLESSMVRVGEFARSIIPLGTTTIVADPHEIANVAGLEGIKYLLEEGLKQPWNFKLMLPSCVPATLFESSGANLQAEALKQLLDREGIFGLGEVMDYPGVISGDEVIWEKIALVGSRFKDGHAPGLRGKELNAYLLAGIRADHECTTGQEALEKVSKGMYVMIREGSVTRDLINLLPAVNDQNLSRFLLATDDRHPEDLIDEGHLNYLIKKAVDNGLNFFKAVKLATINPAIALGLEGLGALAPGYRADLVVIDNRYDFKIRMVFKDGELVAKEGKPLFSVGLSQSAHPSQSVDHSQSIDTSQDEGQLPIYYSVNIGTITENSFHLPPGKRYRVIELVEDQVITREGIVTFDAENRTCQGLREHDLVKIGVVERHHKTGNVGLGLLRGYGLSQGAVATSVGHDSHNIIVAGLKKEDMLLAVREVARLQGGIVYVNQGRVTASLPLPVGGLISLKPLKQVAEELKELKEIVIAKGVKVSAPFMTLSFMALPVIPELKITDRGLFDIKKFNHVPLVIE